MYSRVNCAILLLLRRLVVIYVGPSWRLVEMHNAYANTFSSFLSLLRLITFGIDKMSAANVTSFSTCRYSKYFISNQANSAISLVSLGLVIGFPLVLSNHGIQCVSGIIVVCCFYSVSFPLQQSVISFYRHTTQWHMNQHKQKSLCFLNVTES